MVYYAREEKLFELVTRIFADTPPESGVDAVCIFGETADNESSMLGTASEIWGFSGTNSIAVTGYEGLEQGELRVSSSDELVEKLVRDWGVPRDYIAQFPLSKRLPPCTDAEAIGLVEFATARGWKTLAVTVPPLHAVRAYISLVSAVIKAGSDIRVWSAPGAPLPWTEKVMHSQTAPRARRCDQFDGELVKLIRYRNKGDHVWPEEILEYMNWRDNA